LEELAKPGSREHTEFLRGVIAAFDEILTGKIEAVAKDLLGIKPETPRPPEDYMPTEPPEED
jgi:hypothetical protein